MNNSTLVESYFGTKHPSNTLKNSAVELGFHQIDTIASMLTNMRESPSPALCEAIGQHIKEINMMTFLAYEKTVKH